MYSLTKLTVSPFDQNCRLLWEANGESLIVDPGGDVSKILEVILKERLKIVGILLTHSHIDHAGGVMPLLKKLPYKIPLYGHISESVLRQSIATYASMLGKGFEEVENCPEPSNYLTDGDNLPLLPSANFEILHTPGHSPGHLVFWDIENNLLLAGDAIFAGSVGRTDLPLSDPKEFSKTLERLKKTIPPETKILSGHGPDTTMGHELKHNPFLQ
jgi:glyoxylase-like metal-dependent hydrolase (beta-lactamase superfamily II)